jgi:activating signal cointegrator 1
MLDRKEQTMNRVISLTQPWATLVVIGAKHFETRSWFTGYRGSLMIHASKGFPAEYRALSKTEPFKRCLQLAGYDHPDALPIGALVGRVTMIKCTKTIYAETEGRGLMNWEQEQQFGDFSSGRCAWLFTKPERIVLPIPCAGKLGLWNTSEEIDKMLAEAQWLSGPK